MKLINSQFVRYELLIPATINFEILAKSFMKLLSERYVSPDKLFQLARILGISEDDMAQIIIFMQMRDAIRNTAPKLYKSIKHRQDILEAIIEALEELEEEEEENE